MNGPRNENDDCFFRAPPLPGNGNTIQLDFMNLSTLPSETAEDILREAHAHGCLRGFANNIVEQYRLRIRNHLISMSQRFHSAPTPQSPPGQI